MMRNQIFVALGCAVWLATGALASAAAQQPWTGEELRNNSQDFHKAGVLVRYRQIARLAAAEAEARAALVASVHGDHREYKLKIEALLDQLAEERWAAREDAERTLIEIGGRALAQIEDRAGNGATYEEQVRARRILDAIIDRGTEAEEAETRLMRGFVAVAALLKPGRDLAKGLTSALGHTDPFVVEGAMLALGHVGDASDLDTIVARIENRRRADGLRRAALAALGRLEGPEALEAAWKVMTGEADLSRSEAASLLRDVWQREDGQALRSRLAEHPDPLIAGLAGIATSSDAAAEAITAQLQLGDQTPIDRGFLGLTATGIRVEKPVDGVDVGEIAFFDCDVVDFGRPEAEMAPIRLFLTQGSLITGKLAGVDETHVTFESPVFGTVRAPRAEVQGVALDKELDRLVGASNKFDRVRMKDRSMVDCTILRVDDKEILVKTEAGGEQKLAPSDVAGFLFQRPAQLPTDQDLYTRVDLVAGDRLLAHVGHGSSEALGIAVPGVGATSLGLDKVRRLEFGVGGGALWGFTLIADYSDNRIMEVDDQGREGFALEEVYGAWDVECLESGNLLVTEFALNRVVEVTREGDEVWSYDSLKNPYDADRLPNGNTLIADTFGDRVVEVTPAGEIAWEYSAPGEIKPYDVNRLANGNTLIADGRKDRVLEINNEGEIVWELTNIDSVHDVDRLPNGNTLITQRVLHRVIEVDRNGNEVFKLEGLSSPSDADRLPNGHTIVAENGHIREFDRRGNLVWEKEVSWAVEVNKY